MNKIIFRHKDFTNFRYRTLSRILFHYPWPYLIFSRRVFTFFFFLLLFLCNLPASNRCRSSTKSIRIGRKQMRLELEMDDFKMCESCCNLEKFSTPCSRYCARIKSPIFLPFSPCTWESARGHERFETAIWTCMGESLIVSAWSEANNINICFYKINFERLVMKK